MKKSRTPPRGRRPKTLSLAPTGGPDPLPAVILVYERELKELV
jgi:hypothetical protein